MNRALRDLRHQLSAPMVLVALALLVTASVGVVAEAYPRPEQSDPTLSVTLTYTSEYVFEAYASYQGGSPLGGAVVTITLGPANSSGPLTGSVSGVTSASGLATLDLNVPLKSYRASFQMQGPVDGAGYQFPLPVPPPQRTIQVLNVFSVVEFGEFSTTPDIFIAYPAPSGVPPSGLSVEYYLNETRGGAGGFSRNYSGNFGPLTSVPTRYQFAIPDGAVLGFPLVVLVVNSTGGVVAKSSFDLSDLIVQPEQLGLIGSLLIDWVETMAFVILVAGVSIGYVSYGSDRLSGALEPVLALPLSRLEVPALRFASSAVSLGVGVTIATSILVGGLDLALGPVTPVILVAAVWIGAMAEGLAILALVFLFSHLARSPAPVLAGGLVLAVAFTSLWGVVTTLVARLLDVSAIGRSTLGWQGSVGLLSPTVTAENPIEWALAYGTPHGSPFFPSAPDPVIAALVLALWVALPLVGTFALARWRD